MAQPYSARSRAIEPFHVMALLARANELQAAGHDVIHLEIGEPDFTTAEPIILAGQAALANGKTRYTAARGLPELREAISGFYQQRYGLSIDPQRILITPGGSGALLLASSLLVDPGKHWLLADPGYPCNRHFLRLVEGAAQLVPVGPDVRYQLTADLVARHWDQDSVGALVASPANPTGTILTRDELAGLSGAIKARNGHLVVDEIYHGLTYGTDAASVLEVDDDAFVLNSFSKYFGMTGWRLGWLVAPLKRWVNWRNWRRTSTSVRQAWPSTPRWPVSPRKPWRFWSSAVPNLVAAVTSCCRLCVSWGSVSPWSPKVLFICMPISARSAAMPSRFAGISSKPSMWPLRPGWISVATRRAITCGLPTRKTSIGCKKRWSGSPVVCGAGKADAF